MRFWTKAFGLGTACCLALVAGAQQPQTGQTGKQGHNEGAPGGAGQNAPRFDAQRFIKDHDKNGDGKLSKDELPQAAQQDFAQIDSNKDGFISADELRQHADRMAQQRPQLVEVIWYAIDVPEDQPTVKELQSAYDELRKLDKNKDGKIDEGEVKALREERKKERIDGIFSALDKNKDGKISKDEARGLWADNFASLDKNKDGMLDRQEVEAACQSNAGSDQGAAGGHQADQGKK